MSDAGAWWLPILEKAMAKYTKSYLDLDGGMSRVALRAMTGMPVMSYVSSAYTDSELFDLISAAD